MALLPVGVIYPGVLPIGIPAAPTESQIQTSDVTTLNADTNKHGFMPKNGGVLTQFYNGQCGQTVPVVQNLGGASNFQTDVLRGDLTFGAAHDPLHGFYQWTDCEQFAHVLGIHPWYLTVIASGTYGYVVADSVNHPGVFLLKAAAGANSGCILQLSPASNGAPFLLGGGEFTDIIFRTRNTTNVNAYMGFHNSVNQTAPTKGTFVSLVGTTMTFTGIDTGTTNGGAPYTFTNDVWYRLRIDITSMTSAVAHLYTCSNGALVWTEIIATNAMTSTAVTHAIVTTFSTGGVEDLMYLDFVDVGINRTLVR